RPTLRSVSTPEPGVLREGPPDGGDAGRGPVTRSGHVTASAVVLRGRDVGAGNLVGREDLAVARVRRAPVVAVVPRVAVHLLGVGEVGHGLGAGQPLLRLPGVPLGRDVLLGGRHDRGGRGGRSVRVLRRGGVDTAGRRGRHAEGQR